VILQLARLRFSLFTSSQRLREIIVWLAVCKSDTTINCLLLDFWSTPRKLIWKLSEENKLFFFSFMFVCICKMHIYTFLLKHLLYLLDFISPLKPNDPYSGRAAPLTSKCYILCIYSTNTSTEHFKRGIYSPCFSLQNAVCS